MQNGNRLFNIPFTTYATVTGLLTAIFGLLIIIAWQHDIAFLKTFRLGETAITANLAACFLLSGLSLILLQFSRPSARILVRVISITIIIIALLTILEIVFSVNFGIDEIFFRNFFPSGTIFGKTRMALTSAISAFLTAFILLFLSLKNIRLTFFIVFCFVLILSINIIGFIVLKFHLDDISKVTGYTNMSVIATLLFLIMFLGLFFTFFSKVPFKILIDQTFFAGVVFLISFILMITLLSYSERRSMRESNEKEDNTQIAKNYLNHLADDVLDIETGVRGYMIINNEDYLIPIKTTRADLPVSIHELSNFFQGNLIQKARIDTLNQLIMYEIVHAELIVSVIKSEGENAGKSLFQKGKGRFLTDSIRSLVNQIKAEENQNLKKVNYKENQFSKVSQKITVINVIIQLTLLIIIFSFFRRDINQRRKTIKEVQMLNEELENKVAERTVSLTKSEEQFRALFEKSPLGIAYNEMIYDTSGKPIDYRFLEVNEAYKKIIGIDPQGKKVTEAFPGIEKQSFDWIGTFGKVVQTGEQIYFEQFFESTNRWYDCAAFKSRKNQYAVVFQDVTERKQAEVLLRESEEKFRRIFENVQDLYYETSIDGTILEVSPSIEILSNGQYHRDDLIGKSMFDFYSNASERDAFFSQIKERGTILDFEITLKNKDGSQVPCSISSKICSDALGNPEKIIGSVRNISERKQAENEIIKHRENLEELINEKTEELKQTATRLKLAVHAGGFGVWDYDIVNNIIKWDDQMYELYGLNKSNFGEAYDAWQKGLHPDDRAQGDLEIQMAITGKKEFDTEFRVVWPDGTIRIIKAQAIVQRDDDGNALRMVGTNWDITSIRQAEADIISARNEAENANNAKSEFLANMSHEIRTPMNAVLGYTELLGNTLVDQIQKDYVNSIKSSGRSLLTLINDILDLSKIEAGKLELEYDFIDTYSFFSEFEKIFSLKVSEKGLKFILDIASGTPHGIYIDEARVRQIVFNLIGNAIKFTSEGQITLKVFIENPQVVNYTKEKSEELIDLIIEVIDTGIGISKELREAIFEPFVQERDYKHYGGTGLGLAITRRLTMLMNGTINLKSELGKGTTFTVKIPEITYKRDFSGTNIDFQIDPAEIIFEEAVILIADDVEHNRSYLKDALKNTNLKIIEAEDGFDAYQLAKKVVPDMIIADIRMPKLDGFQLLKKLKTNKKLKHIPVIAYSASVLKAQKERIHNSEFKGLLIKPVKVAELYLELMNILPYRSNKVPEPEKSLSEVDLIGEINDLPALIHILDTSLYATWKTFAVTQPIGEIRDFGRNLVQLGTDHNSSIIKDYGRELIIAADSYNIGAMLKLIGKYSGIIENLKESPKKTDNE
jgi:PAS domain S-box-containing protein